MNKQPEVSGKKVPRNPLPGVRTPGNVLYMETTTTTTAASFGTSLHGADFDGQNPTTRGIVHHGETYTAMTNAFSRDFKTLRGATAYLVRMGYAANGRRL